MIVILRPNPDQAQLESLIAWLSGKGIQIHTSVGMSRIILGLMGDTSTLDIDLIAGAGYRRRRQAHSGAV